MSSSKTPSSPPRIPAHAVTSPDPATSKKAMLFVRTARTPFPPAGELKSKRIQTERALQVFPRSAHIPRRCHGVAVSCIPGSGATVGALAGQNAALAHMYQVKLYEKNVSTLA